MKKICIAIAALVIAAPAHASPSIPEIDIKAYCVAFYNEPVNSAELERRQQRKDSEIIHCIAGERAFYDGLRPIWPKISDEDKAFCAGKATGYGELYLCVSGLTPKE